MGGAQDGDSMVMFPQQVIPTSQDTTIIAAPLKRLYGPDRPIPTPPGPMVIYTVPAGKRATVTGVIAVNTEIASPPTAQFFSLSIGTDAPEHRIFSDQTIDAVERTNPLPVFFDLEEGEFLEATVTSDVTLTISGYEYSAE